MKYNLRNRPKYDRVHDVGSPDWYTHHKDEEWFIGFENELREKLASIEQFKKKNEKHRRFHEYPNGMLDMITEVLGVKPKVKEETKK